MKSVLISIKPKWCELIANGKKTIEVRKTKPKIETPFKCYIYCTKSPFELVRDKNGNITLLLRNKKADITDLEMLSGKVIGEFVCDEILQIIPPYFNAHFSVRVGCALRYDELCGYLEDKGGYGWHISDLKIYDKPKELSEFRKCEMPTGLRYENDKITRPPQSWCYVE